ncbi:MAG: PD-(D/E)XK nuclease domain-containing protein [Clostridia bacterium]|nr:PD-(D/E)XK nuclease domain-containing protein [Clostridia bacterium]
MFLAGLFSGVKNLSVESNRETGKGRADIIIKDTSRRYVAIFELKRAKNDDEMSKLCDEALRQIENNKYYTPYKRETVFKYGIAFSGKDCLVQKA